MALNSAHDVCVCSSVLLFVAHTLDHLVPPLSGASLEDSVPDPAWVCSLHTKVFFHLRGNGSVFFKGVFPACTWGPDLLHTVSSSARNLHFPCGSGGNISIM